MTCICFTTQLAFCRCQRQADQEDPRRALIRTLLILLTSFVLVSPASAATINNPWFARADAVAAAYWKAEPACPAAQRIWERMPYVNDTVADAQLGGCVRRIAQFRLDHMSYGEFCDVSVHEYGHLLGYNHAGDTWPVPGPTPQQDPVGVMSLTGARIPGCHPYRTDGRTRSKRRSEDRRWCAKNPTICIRKYPNLASASLSR